MTGRGLLAILSLMTVAAFLASLAVGPAELNLAGTLSALVARSAWLKDPESRANGIEANNQFFPYLPLPQKAEMVRATVPRDQSPT